MVHEHVFKPTGMTTIVYIGQDRSDNHGLEGEFWKCDRCGELAIWAKRSRPVGAGRQDGER